MHYRVSSGRCRTELNWLLSHCCDKYLTRGNPRTQGSFGSQSQPMTVGRGWNSEHPPQPGRGVGGGKQREGRERERKRQTETGTETER